MQKKNYLHKTLALVMAFLMIVTMMPVNVFADPSTGTCTANPNKVSSSSIVKDQDKKQGPPTKDDNGVILEGFDEHGQEYVAADKVITRPVQAPNQSGVFGRAYDMTGRDFNAADNNNPLPDGTVIYFQWMDSDGVKSPIFTCKTYHVGNGPKDGGWYAYDPDKLDFKDGNGKVHKLAYQTARQYYRFWLAPGQKSPNGNNWTTARQAPGGQVGFYRADKNAAGTFMLAGFNYQKTSVFVYEVPNINLMTSKTNYKKDTAGPLDREIINRPANTVSGNVWWETNEGNTLFPQSTAEPFVQQTLEEGKTGIRVITSALTDKGIAEISKFNKHPMNTRIKEVAETIKAHPEYIQQTVEAPVVSINGIAKYAARFDDPIDVNYLYQYAIDGKGNILNIISGFPVPIFNAGNEFTHTAATANAGTKGGVYNLHLALVNDPFKSSIQITNYDTTVEGAASPGDEAKIEVEANYLPGNKVEIVWVDADGNEISKAEVNNKTDAESKTYTVPKNLTEKTAYSVQLRINGTVIDSDSFIADPATKIKLHRNLDANDKYVDIIKVEDPDSRKVELQALRNTDKYQEVKNKYFVGWSTNKNATQPDENVLIDKDTLGPDSTTDLYVRDGSVYKYRDDNCVPVKDLYAVWKDPFTVKASKKWVDTAAANYDTKTLKFGLLHRAAVGTFGKEVVAGLATYEPVLGKDMIKAYTGQELVWDNLPSYKEEGKRISYLIVELPTDEMVKKYNAGSTDWDSYNINVVKVDMGTYSYNKKEQTLSMKNTTTNKVDAITSSTKRLHIINGQAVDPHAKNLTAKPGYFDTEGYEITVTNKKQTLTPPSIVQAKSGDKELVINLKAGEDIDGLKGTFTSSGTSTDFAIKKDPSTNGWTITKADGSAFNGNGVTVDTTKSTTDKVVLKLDDAHALKADDNLIARTYKTVDGNDVVSSDDTMTVKDNNSRLPKNIKQAYSDKEDKVVITATPFQQDVNGQMITVVPSTTTYKLVDANGKEIPGVAPVFANNNEIKFEIDKSKVSEGTEYFIQAKEPDRDAKDTREVVGGASEKGVASDKSVKIDKTAPQGTIPDIKGFVGKKIVEKTFDITEASGKINVIEREGPNGLKSSINGTQATISGTPTVPYNGQTKLIVEDMFGNKATLTGEADIYAKVVDKVPTGEEKNYYSVTFKSDDNSWLLKNGVKISEITKYIIKDFNGDGEVNEADKITLAQAEDEGLMIPEYKVIEGYKEKAPKWNPNFEAQDYKFGTDDAVFTLQTEKLQSIIPVKPGNDGTLPVTPKGYVRVTLDKDKTVKFAEGKETIYDVRVADKVRYADVYQKVEAEPVDNNYKNVSWYKGDAKVNGSDTITEKTTLTAKAENAKSIIPVDDPNSNPNPPAGYVRITIAKGNRIESVTGVTTYDVKSDGSVRYGDIIDYVEAEDKKVDATTNAKNGKTQINIAKDNEGNAAGRLPYTWKVDNADVVRDAGPGTENKTLTVSATMLDKDTYDPQGQVQNVEKDSTPDPKKSIENPENLPKGTEFKYVKEETDNEGKKTYTPENPDTSTTGEKDVKVQVTYPDGSTDIVETKINVVPKDKIIKVDDPDNNPKPRDGYVRVTLVNDTTSVQTYKEAYDVKNDGTVRFGDVLNKATAPQPTEKYTTPITWKDGNAEVDKLGVVGATKTLTAFATLKQSETYDPQGKEQTVEKGSTPDPKKSIENPDNLPKGTEFKYVKEETDNEGKKTYTPETPDTSTIGEKDVKVQVTYPDGSTDIVDAKIKVVEPTDVIPYEPNNPEKPTDPKDNNIPKKDENEKDIDAKDFVRVAFKVDPNPSGTLTLGNVKDKSVISALVKITKPLKEWSQFTMPTTNDTDTYKFLKWIMPENKVIANDDIAVAKFIKNGDKIDPNETLPDGVHKVTLKQGTGVENNEKYATYAVFDGKTLQEAGIVFDPVAKKGFKDAAWYDADAKVADLKTINITGDKTFEAKAELKETGDVIPYTPDKPDDPTNPNDKNVPTEDTDGNPIKKDDYIIVAFKIGQPGAATLVLGSKKGEVVSALVKKTNPLKKWSELTLPTIGQTMDQNNKYTFEKWVDATKAEMTADKQIADKAVYTATFKTNDGFDKDAIIGFNFVKDPTKMEYNEGDKPKYDGLEIELVDKNNNKVTVTKEKLAEYGITIEPSEDTALTKEDDGKHLVAKITTKDGDGADKELTASSPGTLKVKEKSDKDIIPYTPDKPDDPTNPNDKNVPTEDTDGNPIKKDDYIIVAFKIGQPGAATLVLDGKKGEVVSALVKKTDPLKKWSELTLPTIGQTMDQNNQYTFEKWVDAAKAEMTADKQIADKAVYTATFKTNNGFDKDAIIGFNFVKDPTKMEYNEGDKPKHDGLEIELVDKNNNKVTVTKEKLAEYGITIEPSEDTALTKEDDGKHLVAKITTKDGDGADKELTASSPGTLKVKEKSDPAKDNEKYEPKYEEGKGKPGEDVKVPAPEFKDKDDKKVTPPEGTKFKPGDNAPDGVTVNENTGEITVKVPEDKKPGDKITVPVVITYPDGSKDNTTVTVTVTNPEDTTANPSIDQPYEGDNKITGKGEPGAKIVVKDKDGNEIGKTKVDDNGNWTVDVPADKPLKPGDTIKVTQTDNNGKTKDAEATVKSRQSYITLTLDENYRSGEITHYDVIKGELIERYLYTPHRRGYVFEGWSYDSRYLDEVRPGDGIYYPTILYAIWSKDRDYGRRYDRYDRDKREEEPEIVDNRPVGEHKAYMFGYPDGTVRANGKITRAEAAALITRLLGIDALGSDSKPNFPDVPSSWYNKAINAAVQRGIMKGYPDGTFRPNAPITRAEFTQMIWTIDNKPYGIAPFADVIGHWAERPIGSEYQAGRIMGYPDGTFRPDADITRAEAVVILNKIFDRNYDAMSAMNCPTKGNIKFFIDLDASFWGYYDMVEATNTHSFKRRVKGNVQEDWVDVK